MDPIKVDFTKKDRDNKPMLIPPERAGLRIAISAILTVLTAVIAYYVMFPALNIKELNFYLYLGIVVVSFPVFLLILSGALSRPEYMPFVKKYAKVPLIILLAGVVIVGIFYLISTPFFRADAYSKIISVESGNFEKEIEEVDFNSVPILDTAAAQVLGNKTLGGLSEIREDGAAISQFKDDASYNQINLGNTPVRVTPLKYAGIFQWLKNVRTGLPGYIVVDMVTQKSTLKVMDGDNAIKYSESDHFNRLLKRHLRFEYPTYIFGEPSFEVDETNTPYWICPRIDKKVFPFGGDDVVGIVLLNPVTGESKYYDIDTVKNSKEFEWIDRIYSANLLVNQFNYYGKYQNGFWNSIFSKSGVKQTTDGYNYIALNDDVYMYTGVTSANSDDKSIIGFILINQRTKAATYYTVSGGTEERAQESAQGLVQEYEYKATFPLLLNIGGQPTYFMTLKDENAFIKGYAMVPADDVQNAVYGSTLASCTEQYVNALAKKGTKVDVDIDDIHEIEENTTTAVEPVTEPVTQTPTTDGTAITGKVEDIRSAVVNGNSMYYIKVSGSNKYYSISVDKSELVAILKTGDSVKITAGSGTGSIIPMKAIELI